MYISLDRSRVCSRLRVALISSSPSRDIISAKRFFFSISFVVLPVIWDKRETKRVYSISLAVPKNCVILSVRSLRVRVIPSLSSLNFKFVAREVKLPLADSWLRAPLKSLRLSSTLTGASMPLALNSYSNS